MIINILTLGCFMKKNKMKIENQSIHNLTQLKRKITKTPAKAITQAYMLDQQVSCLETYQNNLYVGTNQSKVIVYKIIKNQSIEEPLIFSKLAQLYPHCTFVKFMVVVEEFLVVVPHEQQQLIRIWHRQSLAIMQGFKGHQKQINAVIFLRDGNHIASVSQDSTARVWDIYQHNQFDKQKYLFEGRYPLLAMQEINPDILALGGDDCCITLWDWKKRQTQCVVFGHPGSVYSLKFYYPYLVSSGGDSQVKIWEIRQQTVPVSNKTVSDISYQQREQLNLVKEIPGQVGQNQFFFKLPNYRMLILDSAGRVLSISEKLEVYSQLLEIEYYKRIVSAKVWEDYLLFICNQVQKKQKKTIRIVSLGEINQEHNVSGFHLNTGLSYFPKEIKINQPKQSQHSLMNEEIQKKPI